MARRVKRDFATIRQLPSKRWQVRYTGPDGIRHTAPHTFADRIDADAYVVAKRREIDRETWDAADDDKPEHDHLRRLRRPLAGQPAGRRSTDQGPHPRALPERSSTTTCCTTFGSRQLAAIKPKDVRDWYAATLADRPTMRSHAYSPAAHHHGAAPSTTS